VFGILPATLEAQLDALGPVRGRDELLTLMAYYQIKHEDRQKEEWERAIDAHRGKGRSK
jgi:hypothetical protein